MTSPGPIQETPHRPVLGGVGISLAIGGLVVYGLVCLVNTINVVLTFFGDPATPEEKRSAPMVIAIAGLGYLALLGMVGMLRPGSRAVRVLRGLALIGSVGGIGSIFFIAVAA